MITNLATGRSREPAGIEQVYTRSGGYSSCGAGEIGRHWLGISCGSHEDGFYLNHRTGKIADLSGVFGRPPPYPFFDMNYEGLVRYSCRRPWLTVLAGVLLAAISVVYALTTLTFATSTRALLPRNAPYIQRYVQYDREFGESHTSSLSSMLMGCSPKPRPSSRMCAHLRSSSQGT